MPEPVPILETLLLIDDDANFQRLVEDILRPHMPALQNIVVATTLKEGLALLAGNGIDCVVLDLGLPDSVGLQGMRAIRQQFPAIPLVILTGRADRHLALTAGMEGVPYLNKETVVSEHTSLPIQLQLLWASRHSQAAAVVLPTQSPTDQDYWRWRGDVDGDRKAQREDIGDLKALRAKVEALQAKLDTLVTRLAALISGAVAVGAVLGYFVPKWLEKLFGSGKP